MSEARANTPGEPLRYEIEGTTTFLEPSHSVPLVTIAVSLRSGSSVDPAGKEGLARLALRMLRRGCEGLGSEEIDFRIDALGAEMGVDTSASTVALHAQVIARNLEAFVELLGRVLRTPTFPQLELDRLKRETIAEIIEGRDNDRVIASKAFQRALFEDHPYARSSGGTTSSVETIAREDVLRFYERQMVRANLVVGLSGDVGPDQAQRIVRSLVQGLPLGTRYADDVREPAMRPGRRLVVVDKPERTQTQILVGALGTSPHDEDHVAFTVANAIFGGTFTSRLMREVRSKRGWSYGASARASIDRHRQSWLMWTFPAAQDAAPCLKLTLELFEEWRKDGVLPEELSFIKGYLVGSHAFEIDTAAKRLHQALDVELLHLPSNYYKDWTRDVMAVTRDQASQSVKKRLDPADLLAVVVCTASEGIEPLREAVPGVAEVTVIPFDAD